MKNEWVWLRINGSVVRAHTSWEDALSVYDPFFNILPWRHVVENEANKVELFS